MKKLIWFMTYSVIAFMVVSFFLYGTHPVIAILVAAINLGIAFFTRYLDKRTEVGIWE